MGRRIRREHLAMTAVVCVGLAGMAIAMNRGADAVRVEDTVVPTTVVGETTTIAPEVTTTIPVESTLPTTTLPITTTTTTTVVTRRDVRVLTSLRVRDRVAFITIDDGGYISPDVVRYLNANKIRATSFVMPEPLLWQWAKYRQMKYMRYGNHSNTHAHLRRLSFAKQKEEICTGKKLVRRISRQTPVLFRPPGGDWNETTLRAMAACGMRYLINWNVQADHQFIQMRSSLKLLPGDIILMHYKSDLLPSLKWVMEQMRADNLKPAFLNDYLKYGK